MLFIGALFVSLFSGLSFQLHRAPIFDIASTVDNVYRGTIKESDVEVQISPPVRIVRESGTVCGFLLENFDLNSTDAVPFNVDLTDRVSGSAKITAKPGQLFDCSDQPYKFYLRARRCLDESLSDRVLVEVKVEDTNNHEPQFEQNWYVVEIEENRLYDVILQLKALDADCGHPYGEICRYEISNSDNVRRLFHVSESGILKNVERLNASSSDSYLVTVTAHDCGMRRSSKPAIVTVKIRHQPLSKAVTVPYPKKIRKPLADSQPAALKTVINALADATLAPNCEDGLMDIPFRLDYAAGQGALPLFPAATLKVCGSAGHCPSVKSGIDAKFSVINDWQHNADVKPCDREFLSLSLQQEMCGADSETIELLPSTRSIHIENEDNITEKKFGLENRREDEIFVFDGHSNAVIVPESSTPANLSEIFSFNFWMKRDRDENFGDPNQHHFNKENILCLSDDHPYEALKYLGMNRHHFAVYAKHCKLEVLFRREGPRRARGHRSRPSDRNSDGAEKLAPGGDDQFEPAEWRWHLDEVCDTYWHHYTLNVKFPNIELIVDGVKSEKLGESPEILDDWPMRHANDLKSRLVVGACWQGGTGKMTQHFRGSLSGLTFLPHKLEKPAVLQCVLQCKERLEFFGLDQLKIGEEAIFNRDMSELTLIAQNARDFSDMLRKVSYLNSRTTPTLGDRFIRVMVTANCGEKERLPFLFPIVETTLTVKNGPEVTSLKLQGHKITLDHSKFEVANRGVALFPGLRIFLVQKQHGSGVQHEQLDYCRITSEPPLDKSREFFSSPSSLLSRLPDLDFEHVKNGLLFQGRAEYTDFEKILRQVHYFNSRPEEFPRRIFTAHCSMYGGKVESNKFTVTLNVVEDKTTEAPTTDRTPGEQIQLVPLLTSHRVVPKKSPVAQNSQVKPSYSSHAKKLEMLVHEPKLMELSEPMGYESFSPALHGGPSGALAIVVVVCVCFLLILVVVGALKMHSTRRRLTKQRQRRLSSTPSGGSAAGGMTPVLKDGKSCVSGILSCGANGNDLTWDDAGMTIIVNPIERSDAASGHAKGRDDTFSEMSSDEDSFHDDELSEEEEYDDDSGDQALPHLENNAAGAVPSQQRIVGSLEWDDEAALTDSAMSRRRANQSSTYRV